MDLYFITLKMVSVMLLVAGLLNLPNMRFYASPSYSASGQERISVLLKGSALCTTREWVVCPDCVPEDFLEEDFRIGRTSDGTVLVQGNDCNGAGMKQGLVNFATFLLLLGSMICMSYYLRAREVQADEDKYVDSWSISTSSLIVLSTHFHSNLHSTSTLIPLSTDAQRQTIRWRLTTLLQKLLIQTNGRNSSRSSLVPSHA